MNPAFLLPLMLLVAVVALIRGLAFDLIGTIGAVVIALFILGFAASYTPRGCVQKGTCYEAVQAKKAT